MKEKVVPSKEDPVKEKSDNVKAYQVISSINSIINNNQEAKEVLKETANQKLNDKNKSILTTPHNFRASAENCVVNSPDVITKNNTNKRSESRLISPRTREGEAKRASIKRDEELPSPAKRTSIGEKISSPENEGHNINLFLKESVKIQQAPAHKVIALQKSQEMFNFKKPEPSLPVKPQISIPEVKEEPKKENLIQQVENFMITEECISDRVPSEGNNSPLNKVQGGDTMFDNFSKKNRLLSSKIRKEIKNKFELRPNTASVNRVIYPSVSASQFGKFSDNKPQKVHTSRPFTAVNQAKRSDGMNNIINININVYNVEPNDLYLNPNPVKNLLYVNESLLSKTTAPTPSSGPIKTASNFKQTQPNTVREVKKLLSRGTSFENLNGKKGGSIFQQILKTIESGEVNSTNRFLTIKDLK